MNFLQNFFLMPMATILAESICKQFCNVPSKWLSQARGVCHGVKNDDFGSFKIKQDCMLVALRLTHVSGYLTSVKNKPTKFSRWGSYDVKDPTGGFNTIILTKKKLLFLPEQINAYGYYEHNGFTVNDDVLIFHKTANLTSGEEFQVAFGKDFRNKDENMSGGYHCVDIDVSCLV